MAARTENLQATARTLLKLSVGFVTAYSANIEYNVRYDSPLRRVVSGRIIFDTSRPDSDVQKALGKIGHKFFVNSIDEMIKDNLRSGDVIVFTKKWYYCHIHTIITRYMYRMATRCDFDHFGVIVQDKGGEPYVLECTLFNGYRLRRYDERIFLAKSSRIGVYPLLPRDEDDDAVFSAAEKGEVRKYVEGLVLHGSDIQRACDREEKELGGRPLGHHHFNMIKFLVLKALDMPSTDPNVALVACIHRRLGLRLTPGRIHRKYEKEAVDLSSRQVAIPALPAFT